MGFGALGFRVEERSVAGAADTLSAQDGQQRV
jgi:hypothetical protein